MPSHNLAILSCAGSGKTSEIVGLAGDTACRSLLITYTRNNTQAIRDKFYQKYGHIPPYCDVDTWYSFLLSHFVRPYQRCFRIERIAGIAWIQGQSTQGIPKSNTGRYYFSTHGRIYRDKVSEFGIACNNATGGRPIARLAQIYSAVYIDEFQDLAGWDLEIVEALLRSSIRTTIVGDHRQHTYRTNDSSKYKQYQGEKVLNLIKRWQNEGLCNAQPLDNNRRGCQAICDFADYVFPYTHRMTSLGVAQTGHDGIFVVTSASVETYRNKFSPMILRWDRKTNCDGHEAMNFGESKGLSFDRVLIYPNKPIRDFLEKNDTSKIKNARAKLYVGITRARYSVAFVLDGTCRVPDVTRFTSDS
jgi:DNA helicase-2/ATP-dependent DNA helicase PcrA